MPAYFERCEQACVLELAAGAAEHERELYLGVYRLELVARANADQEQCIRAGAGVGPRPPNRLIEALDAVGDEASAYTWRKKALAIDQMNIRLIGALLEGAERFKASQKEVLYWGEFGNHIAPFSVEHHIAYARELKRLGLTQEAAFEAESALMIAPSNKEARALATPP